MTPDGTPSGAPAELIPWRDRLLTRTILFLIVPSILPLLVACGAVLYYVGAAAEADTEAALLSSVADARRKAEHYFASLASDMRFVASRIDHHDLARPSNALLVIAFATTTHNDIASVWLQPMKGRGTVLFSREEMLDRTAPPPQVLALEHTNDVAWHSTTQDAFGEPILTASVPIRHPWEQQAAGWLVFTVHPQYLQDLARSIDLGSGGFAFLITREGRLIHGSGGDAPLAGQDFALHPAVRWLRQEVAGTASPRLAHVRSNVIAWSPIDPVKWGVVVQRRDSDVYQTRNRLALLVAGASLALIALTVPLVVSFSVRLTRPVSSLLEAMNRFGEGQQRAWTGLPERGELGALGRAFLRMTEQRLQGERRYREIVDSTDNLITRVDRDGRLLFVNRISAKVLGVSPADAIGRDAFSFVHPDDRAATERWFAECVASGRQQATIENRQVSAQDGRVSHWLWNCHLIYDEAGRFAGMNGIAHDVTERRIADEEKRKLDERLAQSQRLESIGTLAGGVAHDFNNILAAIVGYGSALQMKLRPDDPLRLYADQILSSAERGAGVTQGLLAFSRKQVTRPRNIELNAAVEKVHSFLSRIIGEDVSLTLSLCDAPLVIFADTTQIEQVLMNLATNARDAMPTGGSLRVETERVDGDVLPVTPPPSRSWAVLTVADTGTGMDEATRAKIFEPFFTTKELGRGTGLGLSVVYGVVQQNHGYISVYSEPGKGTTFKVYFPLVTASAVELPPSTTPRPIPCGTETILLAEDDASIRNLFRQLLSEHGYRVIEAADGESAIASFLAHVDEVQLIISDVIMPKKSGRELYREAQERKPGIRVIFTSGYPSDVVQEIGVLDKGVHFLSKPTTPQILLAKIREVLDHSAA